MSQMPAKKKSCFQITSVIQAQAAGNNITDDTESNDDPEESHAEDVCSETLEVSGTELGVCDRSSSEEALDHSGDHHNGPVLLNGPLPVKGIGTGGRNTPLNSGGSVPAPAVSQSIVSTPTPPPISCNSRFRVIKLDLGTGEPYKRGRWACTEFYEKDSESNRTVESMKPTTHDHSNDRDSGLAAPRAYPAEHVENTDGVSPKGHPAHPPSSEPQQQSHTFTPPIGSGTSAFQPTGYSTIKTQQAYDNAQPVISQTAVPNNLNGVHHRATVQTSPQMSSTTQPQHLAYSNGVSSVSTAAGPGGQTSQPQGSDAALAPGLQPQTTSTQEVSPLGRIGITSSPVTVTSYSDVQSVPATVPTISAAPSRPSGPGSQAQDTRPKSDALPLSISSVVPGKAVIKPFITEGLSLSTPTVSFFGIPIPVNGDGDSVSGASVVAIDNKIEQAMDLVKNHLMYAVREEVEVLKEQIKELYERNSVLERENAVLKSLANSEQLNKLSTQLKQVNNGTLPQLQQQPSMSTNKSNALGHYEVVKSAAHHPNITTA